MLVTARVCLAWNTEYPVGTWIAFDGLPADKAASRSAARTLSAAYVKDDQPVVDVEQFGSVVLSGRVHVITNRSEFAWTRNDLDCWKKPMPLK